MANKDRDSKCLDLALKHIEVLEAQIHDLDTVETGLTFEMYKKNKLILELVSNPCFYNALRHELKKITIDNEDGRARIQMAVEYAAKWPENRPKTVKEDDGY